MLSKSKISFIKSLSKAKERNESGLFVAEGEKLVEQIGQSDMIIEELYSTQEDAVKIPAKEHQTVSKSEMERISMLKTPSSHLALIKIPNKKLIFPASELTIALDNIQDPGNIGTIIRLADWFGIENIYCSENTVDCYNPKVIQATMGAITRVKIHYLDLQKFIAECSKKNIPVYGTFLEGQNIYKSELSKNGIIVMGNEGQGISSEIEKLIERKLLIPPFTENRKGSESLNVAIATSIIISEFRRNFI